MDIKFNVYYSTSEDGPWTLANPSPISRSELGNTYQIANLNTDTLYHIAVVGGVIVNGEFQARIPQVIGVETKDAADINNTFATTASAQTFGPRLEDTATLGHQVRMIGIAGESTLAHTFTVQGNDESTLGHKFAISVSGVDGFVGHQFEIPVQSDFWVLAIDSSFAPSTGTMWSKNANLIGTDGAWKSSAIVSYTIGATKSSIATNIDHPRKWTWVGEQPNGTRPNTIVAWPGYFDPEGKAERWNGTFPENYQINVGAAYATTIFHNGLSSPSGLFITGLEDGSTFYVEDTVGIPGSPWNSAGAAGNSSILSGTYRSDIDRYILVGVNGSSGPMFTSTTGTSWTTVGMTGIPVVDIRGVAQSISQSLFVAVGNSGTIVKSTDGLAWTTAGIASPTANQINDIVYEPLRGLWFIVGGTGGVGEIHWSSDLSSWTTASSLGNVPNSITHDSAGRIVAVGGDEFLWVTEFPGVSWIEHTNVAGNRTGTTIFNRIAHSATVPRT